VPPQWPKKLPTKIAFVAEAPSWEEVKDGKPLVGPSGRIFNSTLRTANLDRDEYFVTNVFDEKIPDNKIKNWCTGIKEAKALGSNTLPPLGSNGYLRPEYHHHLARLEHELAKAQPTVIVPLGGTALWAFTGKTNITQMRGTAFPATRHAIGTKLVPTFHPSFLMKKITYYSTVVRDLQFAASEAEKGKEVELARRSLLLSPTLEDIRSAMRQMQQSELLSVDIETGWGQITCIGFAWNSEDAICIPFVDQRQTNKSYWQTAEEEVEAWKLVREILASNVPKLGQNFAQYDLMWLLYKHNLFVKNLTDDTRLLSHALYPELPKDLGFLGSAHSSQGAWKYMGRKGTKRDDT
jgi:uracil-DNA glycosylase